jgi:hypothetical protein
MILRASILVVFLSTPAFAEGNVTPVRNGTQIAQASPACQQIRQAYNQCKQSWQNIGGGSTGQAGSFKECMDAYYKAGIAAGCWQ